MDGIWKVLSSTQAHSNDGPPIGSQERDRQKEIGTDGSTFGTIMQLLAGNSRFRLVGGYTPHTGNGYGTPPQLPTSTELRMDSFTTTYLHSLKVARALVRYTPLRGKNGLEGIT